MISEAMFFVMNTFKKASVNQNATTNLMSSCLRVLLESFFVNSLVPELQSRTANTYLLPHLSKTGKAQHSTRPSVTPPPSSTQEKDSTPPNLPSTQDGPEITAQVGYHPVLSGVFLVPAELCVQTEETL